MNTLKVILVFILAALAVSCESPTEPEHKSECEISITPSSIELEAGKSDTLSASISESENCSSVSWQSNNKTISVNKISETSVEIKAKNKGQAIIKIINDQNGESLAEAEVKVTFNPIVAYQKPNNGNSQNIWTANKYGIKKKVTNSQRSQQNPQWISEGKRIAYNFALEKVYSINKDGSDKKILTEGFDTIISFEVSPSEKYVALSGKIENDGPFEIYVQDIETKEITRITNFNIENGLIPGWPTWSPNAEKIAFEAPKDGSGKSEIFTANPDGTDMKNITNKPNSSQGGPEWSPFNKSKMIIAARNEDGSNSYIFNLENKNMNKVSGCNAQDWVSEIELICEEDRSFSKINLENGSQKSILTSDKSIGSPNWRNKN